MSGTAPLPRNSYHQYVLAHPGEGKRILSLMESGRQLMDADDFDGARRLFLQVLNIYPHAIPALNNLAVIAMQHGDFRRALDIVHHVLDTDAADPIAHSLAAQCRYHQDSLPLMRLHVDKAVSGYSELARDGDPTDASYMARAFPFLLNVLLLAEDDRAIAALYEENPDAAWSAPGLTWVGIALFNQGRINDAYLTWQRVKVKEQFEPAGVYATLAQHVLSHNVLPFRLDYELGMSVEDDFSHYAFSTLMVAAAVHDVLEADSAEAQRLLGDLADLDMPGEEYFLRRLAQNSQLAWGVRLAAAVQLLWLGDNDDLVADVWSEAQQANPAPVHEAAYCLLTVSLPAATDVFSVNELAGIAAQGVKLATTHHIAWITEAMHDVMAFYEPGNMEFADAEDDLPAPGQGGDVRLHRGNANDQIRGRLSSLRQFPTYWDGNDD